jgi:hypothetical protein
MSHRPQFAVLLGVALAGCASVDLGQSELDLAGNPEANQSLAAARAPTAAYHDPDVAIADGFVPTDACVASPAGAMGMHWLNPARAMDGMVTADEPEVLLYQKAPNGITLGGVEYFFPLIIDGAPWFGEEPPPDEKIPPSPILFGRDMEGPMMGHEEGMPWHYDLHVWIWRNNPDGIFAEFNPNFSCD